MDDKGEKVFLESLKKSHDEEYLGCFHREPRWKLATKRLQSETEPDLPKAHSGKS